MEARQVQAQVRIYTINKGELDNFVKHFKEETKPIHDKIGWPVVASWVNRPQNEFIWIRTHEDAADLEAKTKAFRDAVAAAGITLGTTVAKMEVREVEMA
jgi:NIPSNAP